MNAASSTNRARSVNDHQPAQRPPVREGAGRETEDEHRDIGSSGDGRNCEWISRQARSHQWRGCQRHALAKYRYA